MSMDELKKDKRFKLITIIVAIPIIIGLGFGTYWRLQPEESVGWDESGFGQTKVSDSESIDSTIPVTTKSPEQIADEAAKLVEQMKQAQEQQATMVNDKQVDLINEPTPEPVVKVEPTPKYESKEAAAKNPPPPPKPTTVTSATPVQTTPPSNSNSGGSSLVPPSKNPFLNPANASNVQATPSNSKYVSGTGDKF